MASEGWRATGARHLALSERQTEVLDLLAEGYTNAEIGNALGITADGAKWHVSEIIAKLGVTNREDAADIWRSRQRSDSRSGLVRRLAAIPVVAWGTGAVVVIAVAGITLAAMSTGGADGAAQPDALSATVAPTPTSDPLTAEEILLRSEDATAQETAIRVEAVTWFPGGDPPPTAVEVREYRGEMLTTMRILSPQEAGGSACEPIAFDVPSPLATRSRGALAIYDGPGHQDHGASAPESFELLGEDTFEGTSSWIVRYAFSYPSIETPILAERTEWIANDDFRLLKTEIEQFDDFGFQGQFVEVYTYERSETCPVEPRHTVDDLRPTTEPRLTNPPGS